jgi:hypothetical protein
VDTDAILRTPARGFDDDIWAWEMEKHGMYSFQSTYILFVNRWLAQMATQPSSSSNDVWRKIWKLEVPPKVQVFWWRWVHGFLCASVDAKSAPNAKHTASRTKLASHAQRVTMTCQSIFPEN